MELASTHAHFISSVLQRGLLGNDPLCLIDVGCSGGIAPIWRAYGSCLKAIGIDSVVDECVRLATKETNPDVRYIPAFVGLPENHPFNRERKNRPSTEGNPWARLSSCAASAILSQRIPRENKLPELNTWQDERLAGGRKHTIDELAAQEGFTNVDFIKIDIDGHDLEALLSAERLIRESPVLGLMLEVNYYGGTLPTEHTFHNTDRLMRSWGFDLFGITSRKYSAAVLPNRFEWDCPAQAVSGRPYQGDALYLRDAIGMEESGRLPQLSPAKLLKLACLFENFRLQDFAAELLLRHAPAVGVDLEDSLNLLTRSVRDDGISYREHMRRFENDPTRFYRGGSL